MAEINWQAIQSDYEEHGLSLRALVAKYNVPKTTILRHAQTDEWTRRTTERTIVDHPRTTPAPTLPPAPPTSISSVADIMVAQLAELARKVSEKQEGMDIKSHKLFADALSQYYKILAAASANAPQDNQALDASLMAYMTDEEIQVLEEIVAKARERKEEAEGSNVTPLRKSS